jgi:hypothetical protein
VTAGTKNRGELLLLPMPEPFTLSSELPSAKRHRLKPEPVELLIEHPLADRKWVLAKELPDRSGFFCAPSRVRHWRCTRASSELFNSRLRRRQPSQHGIDPPSLSPEECRNSLFEKSSNPFTRVMGRSDPSEGGLLDS